MQRTQVTVPITLVRVSVAKCLVVLCVSVDQQSFNCFDANVELSLAGRHVQMAMDLGFIRYLLRKLAQSTRKKKELQHAKDAMKDETVIT